MNHKQRIGSRGEQIASDFLVKNQYHILERNWRYKHWEVDIVASKGKKVHFVEVKTRTSEIFGTPEICVNKRKMEILKNAAAEYLFIHANWEWVQFDIIAILLEENEPPKIDLFEDVYF